MQNNDFQMIQILFPRLIGADVISLKAQWLMHKLAKGECDKYLFIDMVCRYFRIYSK